MRRPSIVAAVLCGLAGLSSRRAAVADPAPGADVERAAHDLDDPRWEVRRAAAVALLVDGRAALSDTADDAGPAARERLERWLRRVEDRMASGSATAAGRARALLSIVEGEASPDTVRTSSTLLRARVRRLLPAAATRDSPDADAEDKDEDEGPESPRDAARSARAGLVLLLPEARPLLLAAIARSKDPVEIAAALSVVTEAPAGPDDETVAVVAARYASDPGPLLAVRDLWTPGAAMEAVTSIALSLSLSGRPVAAVKLDRDSELADPLRARLVARGDADLTTGSFLTEVGEGRVAPADAVEAARRLAGLGLAPFARMAARRALFLDPTDAEARRVLVDADVAAGLGAAARKDADASTAVPAGARPDDDPAAKALDEDLRAGRFADRLAWRKELGHTPRPGTPPVAIGGGVIAAGRPDGRVVLLDPATGEEKGSVSTVSVGDLREPLAGRIPHGVAIAAGRLAAVSSRGRLFLWTIGFPMGDALVEQPGPFEAVAAGPDGSFWLASAGRRIHRIAPGASTPEAVTAVPVSPDAAPVAIHVLADGTLLVVGHSGVERVDPVKGTVTDLVPGVSPAVVAPFGDGVLLSAGVGWGILKSPGDFRLVEGGPQESEIAGIAGDAAAGVVYLVLFGETVAVSATDGRVLWRRGIEGSGGPVLGDGLLLVPAGDGDPRFGGRGRPDRTLFALTTARSPSDLFSEATVARVLPAALAAVKEGRVEVGVLMLDPVYDWTDRERPSAFAAAVRAARGETDSATGDEPAPEPPPAPEPAPEPAPAPTPSEPPSPPPVKPAGR